MKPPTRKAARLSPAHLSAAAPAPVPAALGLALGLVMALAGPPAALAQVSYKDVGRLADAQRVLPATGPGSALINPAALSETRLAFAQAGAIRIRSSLAPAIPLLWEDQRDFLQLAATMPPAVLPGLPVAFSAGFAWTAEGSRIDGSNAIYEESLIQPGVAFTFPADRDADRSVAIGAAYPVYTINAFGAVESRAHGMNLGILGSASPGGHRVRAGFAWHHLVRPEVRLPDGRGHYALPRRMHLSAAWSSPSETFRVHWEAYLRGANDDGEGPVQDDRLGVDNWELEYRPFPWLGFKLEKVWVGGLSSLGILLRPRLGGAETLVEMNFSHDKMAAHPEFLFGPSQEEGRGLVQGLTLSVGI
jgi:hypothetical protein